MRRVVGLVTTIALITLQLLQPSRAAAYAYKGNCNNLGHYTWDIVQNLRANVDGAEMDQYAVPGSTAWVTCTYAGSGGYGHMDELLSIQGTGSQLVQLGIAKYTSYAGISWMFIYTSADNSGGVVVSANSLFGESPVAGRTYWFHIQALAAYPPQWQYCVKDFYTGLKNCWNTSATWSTASFAWFGGETADDNDTMGARPQASTFRTYAMRVHDHSSGWQGWITDSMIISNCAQSGTNMYIVNCNVQDTNGYPGMFIWNQ